MIHTPGHATDLEAIADGYVAVTPLHLDLTHEGSLGRHCRPLRDVEMICRIRRGWTTNENAAAYERVVRTQVIPGIEARKIPGFLHIDLMRRALDGEIEFQTIMWFRDLEFDPRLHGRGLCGEPCARGRARRAVALR